MMSKKQLWLLTGGNGAGKSTFYRLFLEPLGVRLINADRIARQINPENMVDVSYDAANITAVILADAIDLGMSFAYETVFSHESKIDFAARAKAGGYEIILVYIHLNTAGLNEARVHQRVMEGGHDVPAEKVRSRIPRTMKNISVVLSLADEARFFDNSSGADPFREVAVIKRGVIARQSDPLPDWAEYITCHSG